jgi:hypothetical protein
MKRVGLMIADAVAHSYWRALEKDRFGFTEDRYVSVLKPIVYRHGGETSGYGIKFWPRETLDLLDFAGLHKWVKE